MKAAKEKGNEDPTFIIGRNSLCHLFQSCPINCWIRLQLFLGWNTSSGLTSWANCPPRFPTRKCAGVRGSKSSGLELMYVIMLLNTPKCGFSSLFSSLSNSRIFLHISSSAPTKFVPLSKITYEGVRLCAVICTNACTIQVVSRTRRVVWSVSFVTWVFTFFFSSIIWGWFRW